MATNQRMGDLPLLGYLLHKRSFCFTEPLINEFENTTPGNRVFHRFEMKGAFKKQMFVQSKNVRSSSSASPNSSSRSFIDPATYMSNGEFVFRIPPEAPVFEPTVEEFLDPLAYINKIRPVAEKTGICKVKPPPEWHPPFAVDVDHFKFTPRIQKLNELDANTRVKLYFLDRLATYWNYNGGQIRIPAIDDKTVDMYSLYKLVELEGGFDVVNAEKKWTRIASRMGYVNEKTVAPQLRQHYKRLLLPYEKFEKLKNAPKEEAAEASGATNANGSVKVEAVVAPVEVKLEQPGGPDSANASPNKSGSGQQQPRRCTRSTCDENDTEILVSDTFKNPVIQDKNKELQRLTFYGPGPKILGSSKSKSPTKKKSEGGGSAASQGDSGDGTASANTSVDTDLLADSACMVCGKGDSEECILLCDGCDDGYHTFCLVPPLNTIPKGEWRCPKCIAVVVSKASDTTAFGFEQAEREYSLQQFGEMADQFKSNYFNMPVHLVPTEKVEQEYWKILSSMDSNVTVEYGADLHSMDHGSGFPTQMALEQAGDENHYYKSYVESSWNLNNIPVLEGSVLGYINADISGMKIPWMYVGMCFSTFCWHNEDHWSYSINYLHWGEPKTWYGVPGGMAEHFEQVMRETTPDLFRNQPDLLHQLVTILNPNILMDRGVPVYHIDQAAGEFVLTFPRAYHAGFNHGYNFAEAVNFAPLDWIPLGRECVEHYSSLHRYCVFSHDELICKMASVPENLNSKLASATHRDMLKMLDTENRQRKALLEWGVVNAEREAFELLADDERKCAECNTTCFLSAVTCKCSPKKVTCLRHYEELCSCPPIEHTLRYRYTLDELPLMLEKLKEKADSVAAWAAKVHDALDINTPRTITLSGLKELLNEAREKRFPDASFGGGGNGDDLSAHRLLSKAIKSVQDALAVDFNNILSHRQTLSKKVTLTEIRSYYDELLRIPCVLPQENTVKHFLKFLDEFQAKADQVLENEQATVADVESVLKQGHFPNVEIPHADRLKNYKKMLQLIEDYNEKLKNPTTSLTLEAVDQLLTSCKSISKPNPRTVAIGEELTQLKEKITSWEAKIKNYLTKSASTANSAKHSLSQVQSLLEEADGIKAFLPGREKLRTLIQKGGAWKNRATNALLPKKSSPPPFLEYVERLLDDGRNLHIGFDELEKLETLAGKVLRWREEVHRMFLADCKVFGLLEVLLPRRSLQQISRFRAASGAVDDSADEKKLSATAANTRLELVDLLAAADVAVDEDVDVDKIVSSIKVAEKREFELIRALRVKNTFKKKQGTANGSTYCVCSAASTLSTRECTLCKDLFHEQCLKKLANYCEPKKADSRIFLCPFCRRSRRPSSKNVSCALAKLHKLRARTLEGIAIQCLLDREAEWKQAVNELLKTPELSLLSCVTTNNMSSPKPPPSPVHLSDENKNRLESLLFRGFLLELDLPENEIIYKILHKLDANNALENVYRNSHTTPASCRRNAGAEELARSTGRDFDQSKVDIELNNETCSLMNELTSRNQGQTQTKDKKRKYVSLNTATGTVDISTDENDSRTLRPIRGRLSGNHSYTSSNSSISSSVDNSHHNEDGDCIGDSTETGSSPKRKRSGIIRAKLKRRPSDSVCKTDSPTDRLGTLRTNQYVTQVSHVYPESRDVKNNDDLVAAVSTFPALSQRQQRLVQQQQQLLVEPVMNEYEESDDGHDAQEQDEEETECDAKKCLKPSGEHVDWVQCDYCKNWLHMVCIGVTKHEVDNQTEFMCSLCRHTDSSKTKDDVNNEDEEDDDVLFVEFSSSNAALCSSWYKPPSNVLLQKNMISHAKKLK